MLTYDCIWTSFLENYMVEDVDLPHPDQIPSVIQNAVIRVNNRLRTTAVCNNASETVEGLSGEDHLILLSAYIKLIQLINSRVFYEKLYNPFSADVGVRNFKTQLDSLNKSVKEQEDLIDEIILNAIEDFL